MGAALLGASEAHRVLPGPGFAAALVVVGANATAATTSRQAAPGRGDFCGDEEVSLDTDGPEDRLCLANGRASWLGAACKASAGVGARSALRDLTRRYCLNVAPAKARSELSARPRGEHHSAVVAKRRPPQHEPVAGAAWRDALKPRKNGCGLRPLCVESSCRSRRRVSPQPAAPSLSAVRVSKSLASWRSCSWLDGSPDKRLTMRPRRTAGRLAIWSVQRCTFL